MFLGGAGLKEWLQKNKYIIWYAACFAFLGLIDQRRGSAEGSVQMMFANLTGPAVAAMLIPSMKKEFWKWKGFQIEATCSAAIGIAVCFLGEHYWLYPTQWYTGVLNGVLISVLLLYVVWDWKEIRQSKTINRFLFAVVTGMLFLMCLSVHPTLWPLWFLGLFGCFYLIGVPKAREKDFFLGMLWGLISWAVVQQMLAFAFRPYDFVRYKGFYAGVGASGLFYMYAFCTFFCMWLYLREKGARRWLRCVCFLLAALCISFNFMTGTRTALLGIAAGGALGLLCYDVLFCNSLRHWIGQGIVLGLCALMLLPTAYASARYLPTILHHPIWFEGEYNEKTSVHSYDSWDSEKYISFERMLDLNLGRVLQLMGIDLKTMGGSAQIITPFTLQAKAAKPGDSPENPVWEKGELDRSSSISVREGIYAYFLQHLNFQGHKSSTALVYIEEDYFSEWHAHNVFLQIAYDYGIICGILFLLWNLCCMVRLFLRKDLHGVICLVFLAAVLGFGCAEMAVIPGQLTLTLLFVLYYFGMGERGICDETKQ